MDSDNCYEVLKENFNTMFGVNFMNVENDCNVVSMLSMNIQDANDMQSYKLGDAMLDEDDIFSPPSFDEKICYDENMPPIYDNYNDNESGFERVSALGNNDPTILEGIESYYNDKSGFGEVMT